MTPSAEPPLIEIINETYQSVRQDGYGRFLSSTYQRLLGQQAMAQVPEVLKSFAKLSPDPHMGDGGTYRYRAFSRYSLEPNGWGPMKIAPLPGNSIFQSTDDNPVNGGVLRTFEPLAPEVAGGPLVHALIDNDFAHAFNCDSSMLNSAVVVGVHQVRIVARVDAPGLPTPEGVHRDTELYTFQHFMARSNIEGGEFRAYDENKEMRFAWQQEDCLDTVMFKGTTWHSATPISSVVAGCPAYRDIFLVDFQRV